MLHGPINIKNVRACVCARARARARTCVCVCVRERERERVKNVRRMDVIRAVSIKLIHFVVQMVGSIGSAKMFVSRSKLSSMRYGSQIR